MPIARRGERRVAWEQHGEGPAVVLVPGIGAGARQFGTLPRRFARAGFLCLTPSPVGIAPSSPHHGPFSLDEAARDLLAVLDDAGIETCAPVGVSMGGKVALVAAGLAPERVSGVAVLATSMPASARGQRVNRCFELVAGALTADRLAQALAPFLFGRTFQERRPELVEDIVRAMRPDEGARALMVAQARALLEFDGTETARSVRAPVLCLAGTEDTLTDPRDVRATADLLRSGHYAEIEGAGHSLLLETPAAFEAVLAFLRG